ncbi:hypothetical protein, partial [Streptomyces sp. NPDC004008]
MAPALPSDRQLAAGVALLRDAALCIPGLLDRARSGGGPGQPVLRPHIGPNRAHASPHAMAPALPSDRQTAADVALLRDAAVCVP